MRGSFDGSISQGVDVGKYTPKYPKKENPTYTFTKKNRDTKLFLFAEHTWIRNVNERYVSYTQNCFNI